MSGFSTVHSLSSSWLLQIEPSLYEAYLYSSEVYGVHLSPC